MKIGAVCSNYITFFIYFFTFSVREYKNCTIMKRVS